MDAFDDDLGIGDTDAVLLEDEAANKRQATRNRRIRGLLLERKKVTDGVPKAQGAFDEFEKVTGGAATGEPDEAPAPWFAIRDEASVNLRLHEELLDFLAFIRPTEAEMAARRTWAGAIEAAAKSVWPGSEVQVFGSSSTGLCLPTADVDVAVNNLDATVRPTTALKRLAERLLELGEVSKIEIVQSAKVPVMKLQQQSTGLMADVIINRVDGLETSKFIREQIEIFAALAPLVLFLKLFLLQRGLSETFGGGMGSYLLVCVVLGFLQQHPSAKDPSVLKTTTLGNLLFDFFRYYGQEFRYGVHGISVLKGGSLFSREARGWTATDRNGRPALCLESPLEPSVDIGSRCFKIGVVRAAFNHGYHVLGSYFLNREVPGHSLLCPSLLRADHEILANRHGLMQPQAPPLLAAAPGVSEDEDDEDGDGPPKRRRLFDDAVASATAATATTEAPAEKVLDVYAEPPAATDADADVADVEAADVTEAYAEVGEDVAAPYDVAAAMEAMDFEAFEAGGLDVYASLDVADMEAFNEEIGEAEAEVEAEAEGEAAAEAEVEAEAEDAGDEAGGDFGDDFIAF